MNDRPPPICLALVLADAIWQDSTSGKKTILGLFSVIHTRKFPAVHPIMAVHVALTDGYGQAEICLDLVDIEYNDDAILEAKVVVEFDDPLAVVELGFHFPAIEFPHEGEYRFKLHCGGETLMERRLIVRLLPERGDSNE